MSCRLLASVRGSAVLVSVVEFFHLGHLGCPEELQHWSDPPLLEVVEGEGVEVVHPLGGEVEALADDVPGGLLLLVAVSAASVLGVAAY